jgi:protein-disulfide isomerase
MQRPLRRIATSMLIAAGAFALVGAAKPAPKAAAPRGVASAVTMTPQGGYLRGNPNAQVKLVEFISYTCPHCAHFEVEADAPLTLGFVGNGKGSVEVRPYLRNPIDAAAVLLATCGTPGKFFGNHAAILRAQTKWLRSPTQAEIARWSSPDFGARMRAIAGDLGLYKLMEARGYGRPELDRCLGNKALAEKIANQNRSDSKIHQIAGTPSFLINGELQQGVHDWANLRPLLQALTK